MGNIEEEEEEATTVIVAQLRHCITANHNAAPSGEKRKGVKKTEKELGSAAVQQIYLSKKSGAIISIQMTALCRRIPD